MTKYMKTGWALVSLLTILCFAFGTAQADTILDDQVALQSDEVVTTHQLDDVKVEVHDGVTKICICRCLCFRALQTLATQFADGLIPMDDIKIFTGWTTDGPKELLVDVMGWPFSDLVSMTGATGQAYLTIDDAYFFFVQKSTGKAWKVTARDGLYPIGFFTYRTLVKTGAASSEDKSFFSTVLRPQAVSNLETLPLTDKFDIEAVSFLGEDSVLHIPEALTWAGMAYEVELEQTSSGVFELSEATPAQGK